MDRRTWLLLFVLLLGSACGGLELLSVTPATVPVGVSRPIVVAGVGFSETTEFSLESFGVEVSLSPPTILNDNEVEVWVPAAAPSGHYDLVATTSLSKGKR